MSREIPSRGSKRTHYYDEDEDGDNIENFEEDDESEHPKPRNRNVKRSKLDESEISGDDGEEQYDNTDENIPFEAGQITKVYVENFMCHRKFHVDFTRHLNFVNGQNGSGKSAIVAAIQLCLGATAGTTGRGSKLDSLIREGSNGPAIMRVHLLNEGADAYKPQLYGNRIIVERKIVKGGGSSYQLLDFEKKVVSKEKKELLMLLRTFNIYVDNPCCVLTQEESKKFIHGSEHDKYDFFLKATGLKRTSEELSATREAIEETKEEVEEHKERITTKKAVVVDLNNKLQRMTELEGLGDKIKLCRAKAYWDDHRMAAGVAEVVREGLEERLGDLEGAQKDLEQAESRATDNSAEIQAITAQLGEVQQEHEQRVAEVSGMQKAVQVATREFNSHKSAIDALKRNREEFRARAKTSAAELEEMRSNALRSAESEEKVVLNQLAAVNRDIEQLAEAGKVSRDEQQASVDRVADIVKQAQRLNGEVAGITREIAEQNDNYRRLEGGGSDGKAAMIGQKIPEILRAIQRTRFRGPVFGPIGLCVTMKEGAGDWSLTLERALGSVMRSFVVSNHDDRVTLTALLKTFSAQFTNPVILQHPCPRHTPEDLAERGVLVVADSLLIAEDLVFNTLVDQIAIEKIAMVQDENEVRRKLLTRNEKGEDMLMHHLVSAVTAKGVMVRYSHGNASSEVNRFGHKHLLAQDASKYLAEIQQEVQRLQQRLAEKQNAQRELKRTMDEAQAVVKRFERSVGEKQGELRRLTKLKNELENKLLEMQAAGRVDTSAWEQELAHLKESIESVSREIEQQETEMDSKNVEVKSRIKEKKEAEASLTEIVSRVSEQEKLLQAAINDKDSSRRKIESFRKIVAQKQAVVDKHQITLNDATSKAEQLFALACDKSRELIEDWESSWDGQPMPLDKKDTRVNLEREETKLRKLLEVGRQEQDLHGYTLEILTDRFTKAKAEFDTLKENYLQLKTNVSDLEADFKLRSKRWGDSLRSCAETTKHKFDDYIQRKGFSGTITFGHKEQLLGIKVQTDNNDANTTSNDVRQLSGGERSYVTFCLLLALGHVIECPFRLMDEYDVFLDEISRKMTLDQLQLYAFIPQQRNRQFIVITPHKLNDVKTTSKVKIIKMQDPKRRSAHGLQQQTID